MKYYHKSIVEEEKTNVTSVVVIVGMLLMVSSLPSISAADTQTPAATASLIGIKISAKVYELSDQFNLLEDAIQINDVITGKYVYDAATPDSDNDSSIGTYRQTSSSCYMQIKAGGFIFKSDTSYLDYCLTIVNDMFLPEYDVYEVRSIMNLELSNGMIVNQIDWTLGDYNATALSSDSLPDVAPILEEWKSYNVLLLRGSDPSNPDKTFEIKAHVTEATKNARICLPGLISDATTPSTIMHPQLTSFFMRWVDLFFEHFPHAFPRLRMKAGY